MHYPPLRPLLRSTLHSLTRIYQVHPLTTFRLNGVSSLTAPALFTLPKSLLNCFSSFSDGVRPSRMTRWIRAEGWCLIPYLPRPLISIRASLRPLVTHASAVSKRWGWSVELKLVGERGRRTNDKFIPLQTLIHRMIPRERQCTLHPLTRPLLRELHLHNRLIYRQTCDLVGE